MLVLLAGYWMFAWRLEQIDLTGSPPALWQRVVSFFPVFDLLTGWVILAAEFLSPRVLRHFIPVLVGLGLSLVAVVRFLRSFYDLPSSQAAIWFLVRSILGRAPFGAVFAVRRENFEEERRKQPMLRIGGPGKISVRSGDVVVTERNGRFQRVLGPGFHKLGRFEYPVAVVDVRPQERENPGVELITGDGIGLKTKVDVAFQIDSGDEERSKKKPFPFDKDAVYSAAYAQTNVAADKVVTWDALPLIMATGQLNGIVAEYKLDELVFPDLAETPVHRRLKSEMKRRAGAITPGFGVKINDVGLGRLQPPSSVTEQHVSLWRAYWDKHRVVSVARGEAETLELSQIARAQAEAIMLQAILEGVGRARRSGSDVRTKDIVALRLIEALEVLVQESRKLTPAPDDLLPTLGNLREQLSLNAESTGLDEE
jgi:regulator of protease activity HflC (stomatin/prohibitin superfamily)